MTSGDGFATYLFLLAAGFGATAPWRFVGVVLARNLDIDSELLNWVRAVSTALVAGLVARMVFFPVGALAGVGIALRLGAFGCGLLIFFAARKNLAAGVAAGIAVLLAGQYLI